MRTIRKLVRPAVVAAVAGMVATGALACGSPPVAEQPPPPTDGRQALLSAFDDHRIVGLMSPVVGDFVVDLIGSRRFPDTVDDIVIECGNALHQPILDRYVRGEDVPLAEVAKVWRDTTQISCGYSSFYERLIPFVRRVNDRLPAADRLRVLAADPPVDWSTVHRPADIEPFLDREPHIADVVKTEVLAKNRTALLLFGLRHLTRGEHRSAVWLYEQDYPGVTYVVAYHRRFEKDNDRLEARLASWKVPALLPIRETWLGELTPDHFPLDGHEAPPGALGYPGVDGYLYLGRRDVLLREPISFRTAVDQDYLAELNRRADVLGEPQDSPMRPANILQREAALSVLLHDPDA
ncbi:hypothetical protein [Actinophytocola sediminis]